MVPEIIGQPLDQLRIQFRIIINSFTQHAALDFMFDVVKEAAQKGEALA